MESSAWSPPSTVRVQGVAYGLRRSPDGALEFHIDGVWRSQNLFRVYDDESLQEVAEIMVTRFGSSQTMRVGWRSG